MRQRRIQVKTPDQLARMREAGLVVARTLAVLRDAVRPGISTQELDEIAAAKIRSENAVPSFLGYMGYPATICTSVNDVIVHGIPSRERVLREGDIISIDCGAILDGWHGDAAVTVGVGEIDPADQALLDDCRSALLAGIARATAGGWLGDISHAVERSVQESGDYGLIQEYTGHGIGTEMHMDPAVPNYGPPGRGPRLRAGMALAIEPMITRGTRLNSELDDGWTVVTADGSRAAHFEHTVAITPDGPWILTAEEDPASARPIRSRLPRSSAHRGAPGHRGLGGPQGVLRPPGLAPHPEPQATVSGKSTAPPGDSVDARSSEDIGHAFAHDRGAIAGEPVSGRGTMPGGPYPGRDHDAR